MPSLEPITSGTRPPALLRRGWVGGFFGLLLLLGLGLYRDYGVGWDEQIDRLNGIINAKYVAMQLAPELAKRQPTFAEIPDLYGSQDTDHGVFYQLPLVILEKVAHVEDSRDVYLLRHLVIWLTCAAGTWVVYRLGAWRFGSWHWGLLTAALLVLSPRLFAESFYNYKDPVFMGFFALGIYTLVRWLRHPTWQRALLHALATGAATDVRTMGVLLLPLTLGFGALELWQRPLVRRQLLLSGVLYLPFTALVVVVGWPYLWENPIGHFLEVFQSFSRYRTDMLTVYLGQEISVRQLPWHYVPVWLLVTTPPAYSVLFVLGLASVAWAAAQRPLLWMSTTTGRLDLLLVAWCLGPVLAIIVLNSVIYDGWRHLYFIYPAFLLLAVRALHMLWHRWRAAGSPTGRMAGWVSLGLFILSLSSVAYRMVQDHPYQNMYFSLPGTAAGRWFERDYWALSGREGVEWILTHDPAPQVAVGTDARSRLVLHNAQLLLPPAERARLRMVPPDQATYFLTTYRWHPGPYNAYGLPIYERQVNGIPILSIFRLR
ncbi:phospholipid carrier-dependent glycosyltransferase [Hymenobacter taeanensis]|uniref:Phospholipid carrier-dependent glycosyltransferase n=1 Tax=Hymenobacter taeanensis TaxID=2735321 RepID=A0A6M6BFY7_9BACT|nr:MULTISPECIES: phospholipid carrier-dependent glycosyltransferase [Hymenobacter]QJX46882.1 phospholipid carrier-dependent glycosyltransferase [Hymenobacter taeanensis]UOQ80754.1 phospholipid carrier-dependent glycosyltransferase [Hymenobacter sp. 5414T-23]